MNGLALCAGVGGLELGLAAAIGPRFKTVCYVEGEAYAASVLVSQMAKGGLHQAPIWSDVRTFDGEPWRGKVDVISAGFPCQPWSKAGSRKKTEDARWIWNDIERIICEVRPSYVFLENVSGLIDGGLDPILCSLAQMGFAVEWGCLKASDVGAPHRRERLFILAADSNSEPIIRPSNGQRKDTPRLSKDVADSDSGLSRIKKQKIQSGGNPSSGCSKIVADSASNRRTQFFNATEPCQLALFTRRDDSTGREEEWWASEPFVGRVADGVAYRVDRIRACGNGVVPQQAAYAFRTLLERIGGA